MEYLVQPTIDSGLEWINLFCKGNCVALCACNSPCNPIEEPIT